jgi:Flp pilus assembly protein TadG
VFEESPVRYLSKKPSHRIFGDSVMSSLRHSLAGLPMGIVVIMQPSAKFSFRAEFRRFMDAASGQVAITFGLVLIPLILAIGCGVDISRAVVVKMRLGEALDAAGLAVGGTIGLTDAQMTEMAHKYFYANYPDAELGTVTSINISKSTTDANAIDVSGTARVETAFMRIAGIDYIDVAVEVEVKRESKGLEIALALDNTGSMSGAKIAALRKSTDSMIDILFGAETNPTMLRMALVPFSQTVKVDTALFLNNGWMDANGQSSTAKLNFNNNRYAFSVWSSMTNRSWGGCLEARPGGLEELDTVPNAGQPDTRWVPYFEPDGPDSNAYSGYTTYVADGVGGNQETRLKNAAKYSGKALNQPNSDCNMQRILPLTNNKVLLKSYVSGMVATGFTHIAIGAGWGWRVLSPEAPYTEAAAYDNADWQKALVLMTDGLNTVPANNTFHKSEYTAYNFLSRGLLGTTNAAAAELEQDQRTLDVCERIKASGIRVYSVLLMENSSRAKDLMRQCASDPSLYFESPSAADLEKVFQAVAQDLSKLRLSK